MRTKLGLALAGVLATAGISAGIAVALGPPSAVSAQDPSPPPGMHAACERMNEKAMDNMHQGMMNAGGQMGEWMATGDHCGH